MLSTGSELVASCAANWDYSDGERRMTSPLQSVAIELIVPTDAPPGADGAPAVLRLISAVRRSAGKGEPAQLAIWTRASADDQLRFDLPDRPEELGPWEDEQLPLLKRLSYAPNDPRVDLSSGGSVLEVERRVRPGQLVVVDDAPVETIALAFAADDLPPGAWLTVEVAFGDLRRSLQLEPGATEAFVDLVSDKYATIDRVRCTTTLTIAGPGMTDVPLEIRSGRVTDVVVPPGRLRVARASLALPDIPAGSLEQANRYLTGNRGD